MSPPNHRPHIYVTKGSGNSYKPFLIAKQLGIRCDWTFVDVLRGETRTPDFLAVNPNGQVPFMTLPQGDGLAESNAISWYLAEGSPLAPASGVMRAKAIQWLLWEQTCLEPALSPARFYSTIMPEQKAAHADKFSEWMRRGNAALGQLNAHLAREAFVLGPAYSVADVAVYGYAHLAADGGFTLADYPHIRAWLHRVQQQPNYVPISALSPAATG